MVTPGASEVALPIRIVRSNEELAFGVLDHLEITQRLSENSHFTSHEKKKKFFFFFSWLLCPVFTI